MVAALPEAEDRVPFRMARVWQGGVTLIMVVREAAVLAGAARTAGYAPEPIASRRAADPW